MKATVKETADILKRLSPQNQAYFMTLVRVAEIAENGVKNTVFEQPRNPPMQTAQSQQQEVAMNENTILEQLKREALYAQRSFSTELLYQTYGKAQMARQLEALTQSEFMEINHVQQRRHRNTLEGGEKEC